LRASEPLGPTVPHTRQASKHVPETVPGTSVDRQCGSSQQAIHFAAQAVLSGFQDVVGILFAGEPA
jgi:acetyl-CoA C-acetyltransferase